MHAPAPLERRADAVAAACDDGARYRTLCRVVRDGPRALHRPRQHGAAAAGVAGEWSAEWRPRFRARPHRGHPLRDHARTGPGGHGRQRDRHGGTARGGAAPDRQIPGSPPGRPRVRTGLDAQPGGAASVECQRSGRAVVCTPGQCRDLPECDPACRGRHPDQEPARPVRPVGVCHFRRLAHRAAADTRRGQYRTGAPDGAGACLLAPERIDSRSGDLVRGPVGLPPAAARPDHGPDRLGHRCAGDRPPGRHFRAPGRANCQRRPHLAAIGGARHYQ